MKIKYHKKLHFSIEAHSSTKNLLFIALTLLCAFAFSSCGQKQVTLVIKTGAHPFKNIVDADTPDAYTFLSKVAKDFTAQYKDAKVTVDLSQYESIRRTQKVDDCFGTKDSPDILFASQFNLCTYAYEGKIVPLDDIITSEIRSDISEDFWQNCYINNKTYMIPFTYVQNVLCFNKALFRKAGLEQYCATDAVQSWTLTQWSDILSSLKKSLPTTSFVLPMYAANDQGDTHIMLLLRSRGCPFFTEDGFVDVATDEGIAALNWIRLSRDKGFFPPHSERLVLLDNLDLFLSGQLSFYISNLAIESFLSGIECGYVNFPSSDGAGFTTSFDMSFAVIDNDNKDKMKAAKSFIKYIYETSWLDYSADGLPVSKRVYKKYENELASCARYIKNSGHNINFSRNNPNWAGVRAVFYKNIADLLASDDDVLKIAHNINDTCNNAINEGRSKSALHE